MKKTSINTCECNTIPASRHGGTMNTIACYTPLPFNGECGSAGIIMRIIELARLREMVPIFCQFEELTGYRLGSAQCNEEELTLLTSALSALYKKVHLRTVELKEVIGRCAHELSQINQGKAEGTGEAIRRKVRLNNESKERSENQLNQAESHYFYVGSIIALFRSELSHWGTDGFKLSAQLPKSDNTANSWNYFSHGCDSAHHVITEINNLESALKQIIKSCATDTAYIKRNPLEIARAAASKKYYSIQGEQLRNTLSHADYISTALIHAATAFKKEAKMQLEFISTIY